MNQTETGRAGAIGVREMALCGLFAALMAICSWISIPTAVPFTLQTFGVFVAVGVLGGRLGTLAVAVYLLLGAVGLPVFAGFTGGIGILLGSTGGYLLGFLGSAAVMWCMERLGRGRAWVRLVSMVAGLLVCYLFGTVWFRMVYTAQNGAVTLGTVLGWCVLPFIPFDLLKIALAFAVTGRLEKNMEAAGWRR